jgi:hypothetical protein
MKEIILLLISLIIYYISPTIWVLVIALIVYLSLKTFGSKLPRQIFKIIKYFKK